MKQLWQFLQSIPAQLWVVILVAGISVIGSIAKKLKQQADQRKLDAIRRRAEYEAMRTGQVAPSEPQMSSEEAERRRRLEQLAAQRKAQLEELRRRREAQRQAQQAPPPRPTPPVTTSTSAPPRASTPGSRPVPTSHPSHPHPTQPHPTPQRATPRPTQPHPTRPQPTQPYQSQSRPTQSRPTQPRPTISAQQRARLEARRQQELAERLAQAARAARRSVEPQTERVMLAEDAEARDHARELERAAHKAGQSPITHLLRTPAGLRQALIAAEVLGPPMANRQGHRPDF